ncbi:phosphotransferase [Acuticoccus sp. M5D2P5]|uniref:phosphotransferase family protein n=1 Tax=Acuticoccus kalidii TaxID=2910977 RepID=UPI001F470C32|nr:phosphotransferase [Acuticoccus kalidii]MCF3935751.1 phosphotransferase [Acuticoccus kalidii]
MDKAPIDEVSAIHEAAISAVRPDLDGLARTVCPDGWDSLAIEVAGVIFRFPRSEGAGARLLTEPPALDFLAPHVALAVPRVRIHTSPVLFSEHDKIDGAPIDPGAYARLDAPSRDRLAEDLAAFYRAAHTLSTEAALAAGVARVRIWPSYEAIAVAVRPHLSPDLMAYARATLDRAATYGPDTAVVGHFDTHGWNMAYDHAAGRLAGLFDFAGAGVGDLHRDLSYPAFVHPDLVARIVARYRAIGPHPVDLTRILNSHATLRLLDVIEAGSDRLHVVKLLEEWCAVEREWREGGDLR